MQDLPSTAHFYSQNGEDVILNALFKNRNNGVFVEVGCIDGKRFSNTLTFEERGWNGLCVEAHSGYIDLLRKNRPNSIICHCAAGAQNAGSVSFYANSRGSLSTLDRSNETLFRSQYGAWFTGFEQQTVALKRLDTLFKEHGITTIDIVSIDIEGSEVDALRGIDLSIYRPSVFVIESSSPAEESAIDTILIPKGYRKEYQVSSNLFYVVKEFDCPMSTTAESVISARLIHTRHPLDGVGDQMVNVDLDLQELKWAPRSGASAAVQHMMNRAVHAIRPGLRRLRHVLNRASKK